MKITNSMNFLDSFIIKNFIFHLFLPFLGNTRFDTFLGNARFDTFLGNARFDTFLGNDIAP
jgi:hypothetical protein